MPRAWHQVCKRATPDRRTADGRVFDSILEMQRYLFLKTRERAGEIRDLECQVKFELRLPNGVPVLIRSAGYPNGRRASYRADFGYVECATDRRVIEDVKMQDDTASRLRRAVVEACHGITIEIVESRKGRWI